MSNSNFSNYDNLEALFGKTGIELGKRAKIYPGTRAEWDLLTVQEKVQYDYTAFDDDYQTAEVDSVPTENSTHLVASGGVYDALEEKVDTSALAAVATTGEYSDIDNTPTLGTASGKNSTSVIASGSTDLIESGAVHSALNGKANNATTLAGYNISNAYTKDEIDELFAEHENNISWKPAVSTYADIATTYPNPQEGWTVCCTDTNIVWRYYNGQWVQISANTIPLATASVDGLMSKTMFSKLNGIAAGAEVNQNAFSNVKVGSTTVAADGKTDTLELVGSNVTLTPDANNDKVTIGITKANVTAALGYTPPTTDTNTWRGIQNNLTSSSTSDSLSAYQGKVLNEGKAPNNHASTATTYGRGNASYYGHVKLSDTVTSSVGGAADGVGLSQSAAKWLYDDMNTQLGKKNNNLTHLEKSVSVTVGANNYASAKVAHGLSGKAIIIAGVGVFGNLSCVATGWWADGTYLNMNITNFSASNATVTATWIIYYW